MHNAIVMVKLMCQFDVINMMVGDILSQTFSSKLYTRPHKPAHMKIVDSE